MRWFVAKLCEIKPVRYSTVGCRRTGGRRSQPGSFFFFTTPANLVLIFQSVFESRRLACSARTVCDNARRRRGVVSKSAMPPKKLSSQQTLFACCETVLNSFFSAWGRTSFLMKFQPGRSSANRSSTPDSTVSPSKRFRVN